MKQHPHISSAIAAQRYIHIFAEKTSKRHMPVSPKLCYRFHHIRTVKVFRQSKAHHISQSNCHQRIAPEIKINLKRISDCSHPGYGRGYIRIPNALYLIPKNRNFIGQQHFCTQSKAKYFQTMFHIIQSRFSVS